MNPNDILIMYIFFQKSSGRDKVLSTMSHVGSVNFSSKRVKNENTTNSTDIYYS